MDEALRISLLSQLEQALENDNPAAVSKAATYLLQDNVSRGVVAPVVLAYDLLKSTDSAFGTHRTSLAIMIGLEARGMHLPTTSQNDLVHLIHAGTENIAYKAANQVVDDHVLASIVERLSDPAVKSFMAGQRNPQTQFFRQAINFAQVYVDGIEVLATRYPKTSVLAIDAFVVGASEIPTSDFRFSTILSQEPHIHGLRPNHSYLTDIGRLAVAAHAQQLRKQGFTPNQLEDEKTGLPGYVHNEVKRYLRGEAGLPGSRAKIAHTFMLLSGELAEQDFMGITDWSSYDIPKYFASYVHAASIRGEFTPEKKEHLQRVFVHSAEAFGYRANSATWNDFREVFEDKLRVHIETAYSIALIGDKSSLEAKRQLQAIDNMLTVAGNLLAPNVELGKKFNADTKTRFRYWASEGNPTAQRVCHLLCLPYTPI